MGSSAENNHHTNSIQILYKIPKAMIKRNRIIQNRWEINRMNGPTTTPKTTVSNDTITTATRI